MSTKTSQPTTIVLDGSPFPNYYPQVKSRDILSVAACYVDMLLVGPGVLLYIFGHQFIRIGARFALNNTYIVGEDLVIVNVHCYALVTLSWSHEPVPICQALEGIVDKLDGIALL